MFFTYLFCHIVKRKALTAADGFSLIMMLPWGKDEELPPRTGFHPHPTRFCQI